MTGRHDPADWRLTMETMTKEQWESEKDLIFPDRVAMRARLNAPKKDAEKDLLARVSALEGQIAAGFIRPAISAPPRPAVPAAPRLMTAAQLEAGAVARREAEVEIGFGIVRENMRKRGEL
jgi:hypothetical protein